MIINQVHLYQENVVEPETCRRSRFDFWMRNRKWMKVFFLFSFGSKKQRVCVIQKHDPPRMQTESGCFKPLELTEKAADRGEAEKKHSEPEALHRWRLQPSSTSLQSKQGCWQKPDPCARSFQERLLSGESRNEVLKVNACSTNTCLHGSFIKAGRKVGRQMKCS